MEKAELNEQLMSAAEMGDTARMKDLLAQGADADGESGFPLIWAAYKGHFAAVEVLLEAGANREASDSSGKTPLMYAREKGYEDVARLLEEYKFPDQVIVRRRLGSAFMEEVFDFERLERVSVLYTEDRQPVSFERDTFQDVGDKDEPTLRKAFNEHVKRGGKVEESVVFPHKLDKGGPKLI
jgi:hypothetical protein